MKFAGERPYACRFVLMNSKAKGIRKCYKRFSKFSFFSDNGQNLRKTRCVDSGGTNRSYFSAFRL